MYIADSEGNAASLGARELELQLPRDGAKNRNGMHPIHVHVQLTCSRQFHNTCTAAPHAAGDLAQRSLTTLTHSHSFLQSWLCSGVVYMYKVAS